MAFNHNEIEYDILKSWSLDELKSRHTQEEWKALWESGVIRRLLLESTEDRSTHLATEFSDGSRVVGGIDSKTVVHLEVKSDDYSF